MSLFSALNASVSGMAAQAHKLATISDNVANVNTTGYKEATTQFESLINNVNTTSYNAAGVGTKIRYNISQQGDLTMGASSTDLAIQGDGFFLVNDAGGTTYLTRAGSFRPDSAGRLVNAAGFQLMGYDIAAGATPADGIGGLTPVDVSINELASTPTRHGTFAANLDSQAALVTGNLPSANVAPAAYTAKSSLVTYSNLGSAVTLDLYFSKTATNTWEMSIYNAADAAAATTFPYAQAALTTQALNFSAADGKLVDPTSLPLDIPGGQTMTLDTGAMTQLASSFVVATANADGNAPSALRGLNIRSDGVLAGVYANGQEVPIYKIPLATVSSVDSLTPLAGDVFRAGIDTGDVVVGTAELGGLGAIQSGRLESSTVDLATQLTDMIVAQRGYESNTKVFQTGSELLGYLTNMLK